MMRVFLWFTEIRSFPLNYRPKTRTLLCPAVLDQRTTCYEAQQLRQVQWIVVCYRRLSQEAIKRPVPRVVGMWPCPTRGFALEKTTAGNLSVTRRRFCRQSWRVRWRRPARHTSGSCSPAWKCHQLFVRTASQCSPLKKKESFALGGKWI